jgi:hypothetical protein
MPTWGTLRGSVVILIRHVEPLMSGGSRRRPHPPDDVSTRPDLPHVSVGQPSLTRHHDQVPRRIPRSPLVSVWLASGV